MDKRQAQHTEDDILTRISAAKAIPFHVNFPFRSAILFRFWPFSHAPRNKYRGTQKARKRPIFDFATQKTTNTRHRKKAAVPSLKAILQLRNQQAKIRDPSLNPPKPPYAKSITLVQTEMVLDLIEQQLRQEFDSLKCKKSCDYNKFTAAYHPQNMCKNRYYNILPNEDSRVKLNALVDGDGDCILRSCCCRLNGKYLLVTCIRHQRKFCWM